MKKIALLILSIAILTCLVACGEQPQHTHNFGEWEVTKNATCTEDGAKARYCDCGEAQSATVPSKGHTGVILEAVDATCTETGLTEGKHCPYCDTVFVKQEVIPTTEHQYNTTYSFNSSFHWYACKDCGIEKDKAEHQVSDDGMCSVCDQPIVATEGIIYDKSEDGTYALVVAYTGSAKKIRIADTYLGLPVKTIYDSAFRSNETITSVIIPDSVTSISGWAFAGCDSLSSVVIGDSVTSIGNYAFSDCSSLSSVVIPDSVTSIGEQAFICCSSLSSVVIGDSVTSIGSAAFYECSQLQFNVYENCKYLGSEDNSYYALIEVTIENLSSYTIHEDARVIAGSAFYSCSRLTSIVIPDSVTSIGNYAFSDCSSLSSVVIPDSVTSIGDWAFAGCSSLRSVVIPDSVTSIGGGAFAVCSSLSSVVIGDSVTYIGDWAFEGCSSLSSVVIPDSVTSIGEGAFCYCSGLKDVYYTGSEAKWKAITIGSENYDLYEATIHYNYVHEN